MIGVVPRFLLRQILSVRNVPFAIATALIASQYGSRQRLGIMLAVVVLVIAFVSTAVELVAMDRDGRLDQLRLAAWTPGQLAAGVFAGAGAPWLLVAVVLLALTWPADNRLAHAGVIMMIAGGAFAAALVIVTARAARQLNMHIASAGAAVAALFSALVYAFAVNLDTPAPIRRFISERSPITAQETWLLLMIFESSLIVWLAPRALRLLQRPIALQFRSVDASGYLTRLRPRISPHVLRGLALGAKPAAALGLIAASSMSSVVLIAIREGEVIWREAFIPVSTAAFFFPVFFGLVAISLICREDAQAGRLDIIRLSSASPWALLASVIIGLWLPFLVTLVALQLLIALAWQVFPSTFLVMVLALPLATGLAVVEGWSEYTLLTLGVPAVMLIALKSPGERLETIPSFVTSMVALSWVPWVLARETLRDPIKPTIRGFTAVAACACVAFAVFWPAPMRDEPGLPLARAIALSAVLQFGGSWLVTASWGPPLAVAAVTFVGSRFATGVPPIESAALAVMTAAALWFGRSIHRLFPRSRTSLALRVVATTAVLAALLFVIKVPAMTLAEFAARAANAATAAYVGAALLIAAIVILELIRLYRSNSKAVR